MTSLEYSVTCNKKYVNHVSVQIDDELKWMNVESFINQLDSAIIKNHVAKVRTMLASIGIKQIILPVIKANSEISKIIAEEFSIPYSSIPEKLLMSALIPPYSFESKTDKKNESVVQEEKKTKVRKPKKSVPIPESLTSDTKRLLDIMERSGPDKWPKFGQDSHKRTCIKYIKSNFNNKTITVVEHIYKEVTEFLEANPDFAKREE